MSLVTCHPSWVSKRLHTLLYWIVLFCIVLNYYTGTPLSPVDYFPGSPVIMYKYTHTYTHVSYTIRRSVCNQSVRQWLVVGGVTFFHCLGGDPWISHCLQCSAVFAFSFQATSIPLFLGGCPKHGPAKVREGDGGGTWQRKIWQLWKLVKTGTYNVAQDRN